jgi:hypothetical protein
MGWTRIGFARLPTVVGVAAPADKPNISHIEYATSALPSTATVQQARRARIRGIREPDESCLRLAAPAGKVPAVATEEALPEYSADEVAAHDGKEGRGICEYAQLPLSTTKSCPEANRLTVSAGIVVEDKIYDCTNFADMHPGGESMILQFAGKSCTWQVRIWRGYHT